MIKKIFLMLCIGLYISNSFCVIDRENLQRELTAKIPSATHFPVINEVIDNILKYLATINNYDGIEADGISEPNRILNIYINLLTKLDKNLDQKFKQSKLKFPKGKGVENGVFETSAKLLIKYLIEDILKNKDFNENQTFEIIAQTLISNISDDDTISFDNSTFEQLLNQRNELQKILSSYIIEFPQLFTNPNATDPNFHNFTPLHVAAFRGDLPVVKFLIEKLKVNIDPKGRLNITPIIEAAFQGHFPVVKYLYEHGASTKNKMDTNENAYEVAKNRGKMPANRELVIKFLEGK